MEAIARVAAMAATSSVTRAARLGWAAARKFDRDKGFFLASALAFNVLLSLVPLCLLLLSAAASWLSSDTAVADHLGRSFEALTPRLDPAVTEGLLGIVRHRRIVGLAGLAGLAWTSTMVFGALRISLNAIFGVERSRGTLRALGVDLLMVLLSGALLLASMLLTSWISILQRFGERHLPAVGPLAAFLFKYPVPLLITVLMCLMVYKIAPNRPMPVGPALKASLLTGVLWEVAKQFFGWYVLTIGTHSVVYGSLSAVAILVFWVYYSAVIFLFGAEVARLIETPEASSAGGAPGGRLALPR